MNHRNILVFFFVTATLAWAGCTKVLDQSNPGAINPNVVWNDPNAAKAYMNEIYADLMPQFSINDGRNTDEASIPTGSEPAHLSGTATIDTWDYYWHYDPIRKINVLLQEIDKGTLDQPVKDALKGEAHFWRAWAYFDMVKAYGGVPLVLTAQSPDGGGSLFLPRNKTSECITQIVADIDTSIALLPSSWQSSDIGRVDQSAAFAFKGRVLLYYASPQFNPQHDLARWQKAYDANKAAVDSCRALGKDLYPDFGNVWYQPNNQEVIMQRQYHYPEMVYSENGARPYRFSVNDRGWDWPTLELATAFPMKDGTPYNVSSTGYALLFKDRDPRYYATVAYMGSPYYNIKDLVDLGAYIWTYHKDGLPDFEGVLWSNTSFYRNKGIDNSIDFSRTYQASVNWIEIRFAEVLMNYGESANEVGKTDEALNVLYQIRQRAGILPGSDNRYGITATTQDAIRNAYLQERFIEFAFENKRFWDLRRLRKFGLLNQLQYRHGLYITLKDGFTPPQAKEDITKIYNEFNYDVRAIDQQPISWQDNYYFFGIPKKYMDRNGKLEQTKGWNNGTFDPLQ